MRTTQFRHRATVSVFASCKCQVAIPIQDVLLRYALQQASLEASVRAIVYRKVADVQFPQVSLTGVVLDRTDGNFLLRVHEKRPERSDDDVVLLAHALERTGLRLLERDARDIKREPLFSNARTVWSHQRYSVSLQDRLKIAAALAEDGPQSIFELEERARPTCDIIAALCALACEDFVELNIHDTYLGPHTIVRAP